MPDGDDLLHEDQGADDATRVFYTLTDGLGVTPDARADHRATFRNSTLLCRLTLHLLEKNLLTEDQLDDMLLDVIRHETLNH